MTMAALRGSQNTKKPAPISSSRPPNQNSQCLLVFGGVPGCNRLEFLDALDARSLAAQSAQVTQLRAPHTALPYHFNRANHRRMHRKNPFHADSEAHAPHRERLAQHLPAPAHHHALKRLNTLFVALA